MAIIKEKKERNLFSVKNRYGKAKKNNTLKKKSAKNKKKLDSGDQLDIEFRNKKKDSSGNEIDILSYENISEGQIILGCISEVRQYELIVSLPHKIVGTVPITNISKSYKKLLSKLAKGKELHEEIHSLEALFPIGHFIIARVKSTVTSTANKRAKAKGFVDTVPFTHSSLPLWPVSVTLSILPEDVNFGIAPSALTKGSIVQCSVQSIEDHGYVLDTGIPNLRSAFLSNKGAPKSLESIGIGSVMICAVRDIECDEEDPENSVTIKVSAKNKYISKSPLEVTSQTNISVMLPGTLLDMFIENVNESGLHLSSEFLKGVVCSEHLQYPTQNPLDFKIGQSVTARILYVTSYTHVIHFTLNSNICSASVIANPYSDFKIGEIVNNAKVLRTMKRGVLLKLSEGCCGFCSSFQLKDTPIMTFTKTMAQFPVGSIKPCRIMQYSFIDQLFIVSLKKSVISDQVVGKMELEVGQIVDAKIKSHSSKGATVAISRAVNGFIPHLHLTDSNMKNPENKCPVGQTFKARILKNDPVDRGPILTLKSILITSKLPIIKDFSNSNVGIVTEGTIAKIYEKGLIVEFYGGTKGFLPINKMSVKDTDELSDIYKEGQILRCKVVYICEEEQQIILSTKFKSDPKATKSSGNEKLKLGDFVDCKVKSIEEDKVNVIVSQLRNDKVFSIPMWHLADDLELCNVLSKFLKPGDVITGAAVVYINNSSYVLSLKPIISNLAVNSKNNSERFKKLEVGEIVPSEVTEVSQNTIMVSLMKKFKGMGHLLNKAEFVKPNVEDLTKTGISKGQTIMVKCLSFKPNGKPRLSSCWDDVIQEKVISSQQLLYNYLMSEQLVQSAYRKVIGDLADFSKIKVGSLFEAKVEYINANGIFVNIMDLDVDGIISPLHQDPSVSFKINSIVSVRVLHINYKYNCLELTTNKGIKKLFSKKSPSLEIGQEATCEILLPKQEFILCRLKSLCAGQIVYLPSRRHINDFHGRQSFYEVGKKIKVVITYVSDSMVLADFHHHYNSNKSVEILTVLPSITFKKSPIEVSGDAQIFLAKNKSSYTNFDFKQKVQQKIINVTQIYKWEKKSMQKVNLTFKEKLQILKEDNFPQFDYTLIWMNVLREREVRKNLKAHGILTPIKNKNNKRVQDQESFEEPAAKRKKTENSDDEEELSATESEQHFSNQQPPQCLQPETKGFVWEAEKLDDDKNNSSSDEEVIETDKKKVKKLTKEEKLKQKLESELRLRELELQRRDPNRQLESAIDYEELLQKNSTSSVAWVQYISYYLACAEAEKARAVAHRALKAIPATKEEDRLIVWSALLRLEVLFGTPETVETAFNEAVIVNDELKICEEMTKIYADANKMKEADEIYRKLMKKFSTNMDVWINAGQFNYSNKRLKEARVLLEKSMLSLPKHEHIEIINRFAQFEFKYGEAERGRTMLESILSNFPKRTDIWLVYADLLTKHKDIVGAREVYERMINLKLKIKQMRAIYKKLLEFETKHGTPYTIQSVKSRVEDYVMAALKEDS